VGDARRAEVAEDDLQAAIGKQPPAGCDGQQQEHEEQKPPPATSVGDGEGDYNDRN
jgi:hypothetical protein